MPLVPGEVCELAFALQPISVRWRRGHRVRLALAGADRDTFARLPAAGTVHWCVERGGEHATHRELPVVARQLARRCQHRVAIEHVAADLVSLTMKQRAIGRHHHHSALPLGSAKLFFHGILTASSPQ